MKSELFLILFSTINEKLCVLTVPSPTQSNMATFPNHDLSSSQSLKKGVFLILSEVFSRVEHTMMQGWLQSFRCKDRIVETYDRDVFFDQEKSVAIVRAVAIPPEISGHGRGLWSDPAELLASSDSRLDPDNRFYLKESLQTMQIWIKNTTFAFELLQRVFSIQDLRVLLITLSGQDIDPGNFHRRLKKLDILRALNSANNPQRTHRWEFEWERATVLRSDGLLP